MMDNIITASGLNYHDVSQDERIENARINGKEVSIEEAMNVVKKSFEKTSSLLWRGSGSQGIMQEVLDLFIEQIKGTLTYGSLCNGAGDAGIIEGRGINKILPIQQIQKADTVVVWGCNVGITNTHIMPLLEGKKLVVIDPIKTAIAKMADYYLQIQPRTDYYIAIMLARFIFMEDSQDTQWLEEFASEYEEFYEFTQEHRIKSILEYCGTDLGQMGEILNYIRNQKVVFLVGTGVQRYSIGASTLHAIDSLAAILGLFGKEGSGVYFLGNSKQAFVNPFSVSCKTVSKVDTKFSDFNTVLVQGGDPVQSMPDTTRVCKELDKVETLIYFGLYENETSKRAKIVIPAKTFLEKEDVRLSNSHHYVEKMDKKVDSKIGISEYEFTKYLFDAFGLSGLKNESYYIEAWLQQCEKEGKEYLSPAYDKIPYLKGFGEYGDDEFEFIEDYDDDFINTKQFNKVRTSKKNKILDEKYWLICIKSGNNLNRQLNQKNKVQIHPDRAYTEGEKVKLSSDFGELILEVEHNEDVRFNCVVITSNTVGLNKLTPSIISNEGQNACYQEVKIEIEKIKNS